MLSEVEQYQRIESDCEELKNPESKPESYADPPKVIVCFGGPRIFYFDRSYDGFKSVAKSIAGISRFCKPSIYFVKNCISCIGKISMKIKMVLSENFNVCSDSSFYIAVSHNF